MNRKALVLYSSGTVRVKRCRADYCNPIRSPLAVLRWQGFSLSFARCDRFRTTHRDAPPPRGAKRPIEANCGAFCPFCLPATSDRRFSAPRSVISAGSGTAEACVIAVYYVYDYLTPSPCRVEVPHCSITALRTKETLIVIRRFLVSGLDTDAMR